MKTFLAAAALVVAAVATVQAADIAPVTGHWTKLGEHSSALVYYIDKPDGFHVAAVSVPRAQGEAPTRIVLSNAGAHLHIVEPPASVSTQ
jgi:opacity protein-like surface antigen